MPADTEPVTCAADERQLELPFVPALPSCTQEWSCREEVMFANPVQMPPLPPEVQAQLAKWEDVD